MNGLKALVADDDPITRAVVARPLLQWGFEVATATDGAIAWQYLERADGPTLAVLDWMLVVTAEAVGFLSIPGQWVRTKVFRPA